MFAGVIAIVLVVALFFVALGGSNEPAVELQAADGIENPIMDSQVVGEGGSESEQIVEVDEGTEQTVTVE